jgi:hypothetical protein
MVIGESRDPPRGVVGPDSLSKEVPESYNSLMENDCEVDKGYKTGVIFLFLQGLQSIAKWVKGEKKLKCIFSPLQHR